MSKEIKQAKVLGVIYIFILLLFILLFATLNLSAEDSYKGHYKVTSPNHKISLEELEQKAKKQQGNNVLTLKALKAQEEQEALAKQRELENKRLKQELANKQRQEEEIAKKQAELEKLKAIQEQKEQERLAKLKREEELRRRLIKQRREQTIYSIYNNQDSRIKRKEEYEDFSKNISQIPVNTQRIITSDMYIVGLLENSIDTQLEGRAVIVVEENVYANEGRAILLPKGSRIVCTYSSLEEGGDTRVPMECSRAYRTDNTTIAFENLLVGDQGGKTGVVGIVDNRIYEKYGHAMTMAGISGLSSYGSFALATSDNASLVALSPTLTIL